MKRFIITIGVSAALTLLFILLKIHISPQLPLITFTVCGILFSISMSQLMAFDLSRVVNEEIYMDMVSSKKQTSKSLIYQLMYSGLAFLGTEVLSEKIEAIQNEFAIGAVNFFILFLNAVLIYCFFYFVFNFQDLSEKKLKLDDTIRKESIED